jgi:hypothetical protein
LEIKTRTETMLMFYIIVAVAVPVYYMTGFMDSGNERSASDTSDIDEISKICEGL